MVIKFLVSYLQERDVSFTINKKKAIFRTKMQRNKQKVGHFAKSVDFEAMFA
jgi:hypothetical protein